MVFVLGPLLGVVGSLRGVLGFSRLVFWRSEAISSRLGILLISKCVLGACWESWADCGPETVSVSQEGSSGRG